MAKPRAPNNLDQAEGREFLPTRKRHGPVGDNSSMLEILMAGQSE
jgi:hypothetical protein